MVFAEIRVVLFSSCLAVREAEFGPVAQLVAHLHGMQGVRGSDPLSSTGIEKEPPERAVPFLFAQGCPESADGDDAVVGKIAPTERKCNTALCE